MKRISSIFIITFLFAIVFSTITPALAAGEGGETPQVALNVFQASPGATIEVTGGRFEPDISVSFLLVQNGTEVHLGSTLCDDHGEFTVPVLLPFELQAGQYEFRAIDEKNRVAATPLSIVAEESGLDEPRAEDDALLAPMPTYAPDVSSTPLPAAAVSVENSPAEASTMPLVWVAAGIGILLLVGLILVNARR